MISQMHVHVLFSRLESNDFFTAEHMGTHIDSPAHLYKGAKRLHEIPLEDLIAPMVIIDVREQVSVSMRFH